MTAIKALILSLMLVMLPAGVTAGEVGYNFEEEIVQFYAMPSEDLPTAEDIAEYCPPGWSYEVYLWVLTEDGSYVPDDVAQGQCPAIPQPAKPYDRFGI